MSTRFRFADVRGTRLAWTQTGSGSPVIWAHGLTSQAEEQEAAGQFDWSPVALSHRLIRYDARGHGRSGGDAVAQEYTWPELAADLLGLLDEIVPGQQVSGIGSSMGAATLLYAVLADPDRFERLVLATPPTMGETRRAQVPIRLASADVVEREGKAALEALSVDEPASPALAEARTFVTPICIREEILPAVMRGSAITDGPSAEQLATIATPTLVLSWTGDATHPVSVGEMLAATMPAATLNVAATPAQLRAWPGLVAEFLRAA